MLFSCSEKTSDSIKPSTSLIDLDTITLGHSMKGWEIYSWQSGSTWNYSILMGTNRAKSYNEVVTNKIVVSGVDSLKKLLDKLPVNEYVTWFSKIAGQTSSGSLSLPDSQTVNEITAYCAQKQLVFHVSD